MMSETRTPLLTIAVATDGVDKSRGRWYVLDSRASADCRQIVAKEGRRSADRIQRSTSLARKMARPVDRSK